MEGKVLVICSEEPTVNEYGERIDGKGRLLKKDETGNWIDIDFNSVEVDENKRVINTMDLVLPMEPESIRDSGSVLFANWESVIPSNIEKLQEMIRCSADVEQIQPEQILDWGAFSSMMTKAHFDRLMAIEDLGLRPCIDYSFQAMNDFMKLFSETLEKHMICTVIPAFSTRDAKDTVKARIKLIQGWNFSNKMMSQTKGKKTIKVTEPVMYENLEEVTRLADKELIEIISAPYDFEDGNR
ncbi:MAG: hypothetical protein IJB90_01130 [Clostridia bacterium]|nr:hypothetical protein [Clostridia bacterium]